MGNKISGEKKLLKACNLHDYSMAREALITCQNPDAAVMPKSFQTALHILAGDPSADATKIARMLLNGNGEKRRKAEPNKKDMVGFTPLHHAAMQKGSLEMVQLLIEYGADVTLVNENRETPYQLAKRNGGTEEIMKLLDPANAQPR